MNLDPQQLMAIIQALMAQRTELPREQPPGIPGVNGQLPAGPQQPLLPLQSVIGSRG